MSLISPLLIYVISFKRRLWLANLSLYYRGSDLLPVVFLVPQGPLGETATNKRAECWISGNNGSHGNDESCGNPRGANHNFPKSRFINTLESIESRENGRILLCFAHSGRSLESLESLSSLSSLKTLFPKDFFIRSRFSGSEVWFSKTPGSARG